MTNGFVFDVIGVDKLFSFLCCVFCFICLRSVSCVQCLLCLWIIHSCSLLLYSLMFTYRPQV